MSPNPAKQQPHFEIIWYNARLFFREIGSWHLALLLFCVDVIFVSVNMIFVYSGVIEIEMELCGLLVRFYGTMSVFFFVLLVVSLQMEIRQWNGMHHASKLYSCFTSMITYLHCLAPASNFITEHYLRWIITEPPSSEKQDEAFERQGKIGMRVWYSKSTRRQQSHLFRPDFAWRGYKFEKKWWMHE